MARGESGEDQSPGLARLPPGRHGLSRKFVDENQRGRIAAGTIAVVVENGYHAATVSQIVAAGGLSRRTFYKYYGDKEECFLAIYEIVVEHLLGEMAEAGEGSDDWPARVAAELSAMLAVFAANSDLALFLIAVPQAAGGEPLDRYTDFLSRLLTALTEGKPPPPQGREATPAIEAGLAGGIASLIEHKARSGKSADLSTLLPDLIEFVLTPYLGRDAAVRAQSHISDL